MLLFMYYLPTLVFTLEFVVSNTQLRVYFKYYVFGTIIYIFNDSLNFKSNFKQLIISLTSTKTVSNILQQQTVKHYWTLVIGNLIKWELLISISLLKENLYNPSPIVWLTHTHLANVFQTSERRIVCKM